LFSCFCSRGLGEGTRLLFAAADVKYEDIRFDASAFAGADAKGNSPVPFAEFKPTTPFGQLPVLEVNGKKLAQSRAVERYVAREYGLFGATVVEGALIDMTAEQVRDLQEAFSKTNSVPEAERAAAKAKYFAELETKAASLVKQLEHSKGFLVGASLTYADTAFFGLFHDRLQLSDAAAYEAHVPAALKAHVKKIAAVPSIAAYLAKRPTRVM
jgi:glutathione S-transferase